MSMIVDHEGPRRMPRWLACAVIASALSFAGAGSAAAQAGSTGGSIGKQEKSISGSEDTEVSPPAKKQKEERNRRAPATAPGRDSDTSCRSIVGVWTSWASGLYGKGDTRINGDGTITHPSSKGTWSCKAGEYVHVWEVFGVRGPYRLSPDGKRLIKLEDGSVSFSRN
jgi:hypothetical protein